MKKKNIFVSDCGNFVAMKVPGPDFLAYDVWREDGSEMWIGSRYVKDHAKPTKIAGSWTNLGHEKRDGTWVEGFALGLYDLKTDEAIEIKFHTPMKSLAPQYKKRRLKEVKKDEHETLPYESATCNCVKAATS